MIDGSAMNQSVKSILGGSPWAPCNWAGLIIVFGEKGLVMDLTESDDLDMADFRHLIDKLNEQIFIDTNGKAEYPTTGTELEQRIAEILSNVRETKTEEPKTSERLKHLCQRVKRKHSRFHRRSREKWLLGFESAARWRWPGGDLSTKPSRSQQMIRFLSISLLGDLAANQLTDNYVRGSRLPSLSCRDWRTSAWL
jgi:hypothetical protein